MKTPLKWKLPFEAQPLLILCFAAVYLIWGSTFLGIRLAIETLPPLVMAGLRFLIAGAVFYAWGRVRGHQAPSASHWGRTAAVGALLIFGGNGLVTWAEIRVPSGIAALFIASTPLWMVLLENWARGRLIPPARIAAGVGLGFLGVFLLLDPRGILNHGSVNPAGAVALVLSALCWASGSFLAKRISLPSSPLLASGMEMIWGGLLLLLAATARGEWLTLDVSQVTLKSWAAFVYLIVFGSWVAFLAYHWILRKSSLEKASTYAFVNPAVAVFLGWVFAGEKITPKILGATALILASVALILGLFKLRLGKTKLLEKFAPAGGQACPE